MKTANEEEKKKINESKATTKLKKKIKMLWQLGRYSCALCQNIKTKKRVECKRTHDDRRHGTGLPTAQRNTSHPHRRLSKCRRFIFSQISNKIHLLCVSGIAVSTSRQIFGRFSRYHLHGKRNCDFICWHSTVIRYENVQQIQKD